MFKHFFYTLVFLFVVSCNPPEKEFTFAGVWVDKSVLENKDKGEQADSLAKFPLILFESEGGDSVLFCYSSSKRNVYFAEYAYNTYFVHFDKHNEYFLTPDYTTGELVFSNLKDKEYHRFVRVSQKLTHAQVLDPTFDVDAFIQLAK